MTDDQLASLASQPPPEKYPERYRLMTNAPTEPPGGNRLLLPQPGIDNDVSQLQDYIPSQNMKVNTTSYQFTILLYTFIVTSKMFLIY